MTPYIPRDGRDGRGSAGEKRREGGLQKCQEKSRDSVTESLRGSNRIRKREEESERERERERESE
jgi:hypothetical protein